MTDTRQLKIKIGQLLRTEREKQGLSRQDVYMKTGVSSWQIGYIENGTKGYKIETVLKLDEALNAGIFNKNIFTDK